MPKNKISEYSATNSSNTDIGGINIDEGCAPSGINNAIREVMVQLKNFQTGASGDAFTFAGGVLISGTTNTISGAAVISGNINSSGSANTFSGGVVHSGTNTFSSSVIISGNINSSGTNTFSSSQIISGNINSSGTNTFSGTTVMSGANTVALAAGLVGTPSLYANGDTNTGIFFPAADTIAFTEGGAEAMRINSSGNVGIGTSSPGAKLHVEGVLGVSAGTNVGLIRRNSAVGSGSGGIRIQGNAADTVSDTNPGAYIVVGGGALTDTFEGTIGLVAYGDTAGGTRNYISFSTRSGVNTVTERARITSDGDFIVGKSSVSDTTVGVDLRANGLITGVASAARILMVNRLSTDGTLVGFQQDSVEEGTISVSGNTVSYNAFTGGHWTQLQEGRGYNPEIPRGTVMSSIGEMSEWKSVTWTETIEHPAIPAVEAKEAVLDEEGNVVEPAVEAVEGKDAWTESFDKREAYLGNLPVGATFEEDGFTKTVVDDGNERLPKVKISDVVGDKAVYGVFQTYDDVQDMLITSLGAFVVRIASGVTVQIGDLLESNGDGCAKVQDDDVIRSKTIGKVTSTVATATYPDGSYTVPCVIYCG